MYSPYAPHAGHAVLHAVDVLELQLVERLEAFLQVGLDHLRVLGLREDLDELIVGHEEEPRKRVPLGLEVLGEVLLYVLEVGVHVLEDFEKLRVFADAKARGPFLCVSQHLAVHTVGVLELLRLVWQLASDVF